MIKKIINEALIYLIAAMVILIDQYTKYLVRLNLLEGQSWDRLSWLMPYARVTHVQNTGAAFGMFPQAGLIFTVVAIVVSAVIIYYSFRLPPGLWGMRLVLGMQLGGALGNLVDRVLFGPVTDFISTTLFHVQMPVFNVADSSISCGVALMLLMMLLEGRNKPKPAAPAESEPAELSETPGV